MNDPAWQAFNERIAWEGELRVACEKLEHAPDPAQQSLWRRRNIEALAVLEMPGDRRAEAPADEALAAALARIDAKLDALIEMFQRHLLASIELPARHRVRFNACGIVIEGMPPGAEDVLVWLHFEPSPGLPLMLPGRAHPAVDGATTCFVAFEVADAEVRQGIEHLVFRQHRRQLAEARRVQG